MLKKYYTVRFKPLSFILNQNKTEVISTDFVLFVLDNQTKGLEMSSYDNKVYSFEDKSYFDVDCFSSIKPKEIKNSIELELENDMLRYNLDHMTKLYNTFLKAIDEICSEVTASRIKERVHQIMYKGDKNES